MRLNDLTEADPTETQTGNRLELEPAMIAGSRKSGLDYQEKKVKGVLDKVTLTLTGQNSAKSTILAKKYNEIKILTEQLTAMKDLFNLDAKEHMLQYFNAEDEVLTRVIKTVSLTMTLSKRTVADYEKTNLEGFYQELLVLLPELEDKLKILRAKYTTVEKLEKSPALRVKLPGEKSAPGDVEESINEAVGGMWSKIIDFGNRLAKIYKVWGTQFDSKLAKLAQKYSSRSTVEDESLEHHDYADNPMPAVDESEEIYDAQEPEETFKPDLEGIVYEMGEVKTTLDTASDELLNLVHFASTEFKDANLARKFKDMSNDVRKLKNDLASMIMEVNERTSTVQPVQEELEDEHENMLSVAKNIKSYALREDKNPEKEDKVSMMLFSMKRPLKNLSLFALLEALQTMDELQYNMTKEFVEREMI